MRRREFTFGLLLFGTVGPAQAQQHRLPRIAVFHPTEPTANMSENGGSSSYRAFFAELRRLGYLEGKNLIVERLSGEGRADSFEQLAQDLVRTNPDAIFATSARVIRELKKQTTTIPIVGFMSDPIAFGLVTSLAKPEGNITGISADAGLELAQKRLELLKEAVPGVSRVAHLHARRVLEDLPGRLMAEAAQQAGVTLIAAPLDAPIANQAYRRAFAQMAEDKVDALVVGDAPENITNRSTIIALAEDNKMPAIYTDAEAVEYGGFITYGTDFTDVFRRAAGYIHQILEGTKPSELPIYRATKFELSVNMRTAKALGPKLPDSFLAAPTR